MFIESLDFLSLKHRNPETSCPEGLGRVPWHWDDFGPAATDPVKPEPLIVFPDAVPGEQLPGPSHRRHFIVSSGAGTQQPSRISFELQISRFW